MHEEGGLKECLPADELGLADHPIVGREAIEDFLRQVAKLTTPYRGQELEEEVQRMRKKLEPFIRSQAD